MERRPPRPPCPRVAPALAVALALPLAAWGHERHPWEQTDAAAPSGSIVLAPPLGPDASLLGDAGALGAPDDAGAVVSDEPVLPVRVGGPWVRCYGGFRVSGDPRKDVTRLSFLCGPENGMHRMGDTLEGDAKPGEPVRAGSFRVVHGECYRVFAVAEPSVGDLDVAVQTSHGAPVASDQGEDPWPIVQSDRPFCPLEDDTYTIEVTARRGRGRFAAEVWRLHTPDPNRKKGRPG